MKDHNHNPIIETNVKLSHYYILLKYIIRKYMLNVSYLMTTHPKQRDAMHNLWHNTHNVRLGGEF